MISIFAKILTKILVLKGLRELFPNQMDWNPFTIQEGGGGGGSGVSNGTFWIMHVSSPLT